MTLIGLYLLLATWLLVSAFALPNTAAGTAFVAIVALVVAVAAVVSKGRPAVRFFITALAVALGFVALFMTGASGAARVNLALVAALFFALSLVRPTPVEAPPAATP